MYKILLLMKWPVYGVTLAFSLCVSEIKSNNIVIVYTVILKKKVLITKIVENMQSKQAKVLDLQTKTAEWHKMCGYIMKSGGKVYSQCKEFHQLLYFCHLKWF